ncbi:tRNA (Adenine(37)-N6)-methyltransferase [Rhynchospora pubera]|uniref:tRNA (Adenine(37)-N6)-methyltransferase n=1 Tax=Rhynchospora pubera TaxID=906938 RepID=A0AAV8BT45_9POAL|nr:tRNA (Adenine(37)-N6)-methyltransferase [Rhynchospora pubera]
MAISPRVKEAHVTSITPVFATVAISATTLLLSSLFHRRKRCKQLEVRVRELEASLEASVEKGAAERRGRVRAQQALRKVVSQQSGEGSKEVYPMVPIGTVHSCFSTRNGTPRQPLVVPLARACLVLDPARASAEALEGFSDYSHCWILYVFHLNTDLEKMWKDPARSKIKAKVRVPRLKGGKMGVLATRSPHRPCPIGLSVAKIEVVDGEAIWLSGVDLVDGTPILDIKPYLPYSDSVKGATVPTWVQEDATLAVGSITFSSNFASSLSSCWVDVEKQSLYDSSKQLESLIKEVLTWDIRSVSQRTRPHPVATKSSDAVCEEIEEVNFKEEIYPQSTDHPNEVVYHLILEGIDVSYRIDENLNVVVEKANVHPDFANKKRHSYLAHRDSVR